jgi:hypothetical protein
MGIRITNTREAVKVQASQRSKQALGKKVLELGKEYVLLFPKKENEIVVAGIVGRNCDYDALGVSFGRLNDSQMEINEETGRIKDNSGMQRWAVLSNILYKAAMAKEISDKTEEARKIAEQTGDKIDEAGLSQAINKVKLAYEGQARHGDEAAIMPTKQRLVSSRVDFSIFSEAVLIPLDKNLKPEYDKAISVEVRLSNTKQKQLNAILDDPNYNNAEDKDGFLEVKFSYKGANAQEAGKNSYLGAELAVRKVDLTIDNGEYVDSGVKSIAHLLSDTTHDHDIMFSRAGTVSFAQTAADVEAGMRKYLSNNRMLPLFIDMEDETTKRNASTILELKVFNSTSKQFEELQAMVEEQKASEQTDDNQEDGTMPAEAKDLLAAKTTKEVDAITSKNEELKGMVGNEEVEDI